jgi:hypothetical protein
VDFTFAYRDYAMAGVISRIAGGSFGWHIDGDFIQAKLAIIYEGPRVFTVRLAVLHQLLIVWSTFSLLSIL